MRPRIRSKGQSLVEFALLIPLLFLLIINVVNFGGMFYAWISVASAARTGAQYYIQGSSSVGGASAPTVSAVQTLVNEDLKALPNSSSVSVRVCTNNSASGSAVITCSPTGGSPPADPEPTVTGGVTVNYILASVEVTYTYRPFISLWDFPELGVHLTTPITTIHKTVYMRRLGA